MKRISEKEWLEDFKDFVETKEAIVPEELSQNILARVHKALNPSPWLVFIKLLVIHSVIGTLSLSVCNQFEMNPFNTTFSFSDYFMKFGHSVCMSFCGFIFVSLSVLSAFFILRPEEFTVLKRNSFIQVFILSLLSLAIFLALGAEIVISIGLLWMIGALLGGLIPILALKQRAH